jgi:uncharacterized RDD family membrane protein YckC
MSAEAPEGEGADMSDVQREGTVEGGVAGPAPAVPEHEVRAASGPSGPRAGFWRRFAAIFIDGLILGIVETIAMAAIGSPGAGYAVSTLIGWAYGTLLEGGPRGQTVGKMALGIRVIDFNAGGSIGYGRALVRQVVKAISGIVVALGYLWMLWDREKQTWHDKAANDVVVPVDAYPIQG